MALKVVIHRHINDSVALHEVSIDASDVIGLTTAISSMDPNLVAAVACNTSVFVGAPVRMSGATAVNAIATSYSGANFIGICVNKPTDSTCDVRVGGITSAIYSGLTINADQLLSDRSAGFINETQVGSGNISLRVGTAFDSQRVIIFKGAMTRRA